MSVTRKLCIVLLAAFASLVSSAVANEAPATITYRFTRELKPPLRAYGVNLVVENRHREPIWFLVRYWGNDPLPKKAEFESPSEPTPPFGGEEYLHDGKRVVLIRHYGDAKFIAFQLPEAASIEFSAYVIEAWDRITEFEIWEVSELKVNGRTPLEKWLPYNTLSDNGAKIPRGQDWNNLDWDYKQNQKRTDYRKEVVKSVTASLIQRWTIPISVKDAP